MKIRTFLLACMLCALCAVQASALEYSYDGADDFLFAKPTNEGIIYEEENPNIDRSKNVALAAPGFGSPTSYLPDSGEYLTPNLVPGALSGGLVNQLNGNSNISMSISSVPPVTDSNSVKFSYTTQPIETVSVGFTSVTADSYYSNGSLGTLKIPAIGLNVKIVQGTDSAALKKGAGHFEEASIWNGNIGLAAHNRGTNSYFGKIHTLETGDKITLTTKQGTRIYAVTSVAKVSETDVSSLENTAENCLTLYTCVRDQRDLRWCVRAVEMAT